MNNMYKELSTHDVAHELSSNKDNGFSYHGALALAEYLEQYEEDTEEKIELDTVALRCEYDEYTSASEAYASYHAKEAQGDDEEEREAEALKWLEDNTTVIPVKGGGVIIQAF